MKPSMIRNIAILVFSTLIFTGCKKNSEEDDENYSKISNLRAEVIKNGERAKKAKKKGRTRGGRFKSISGSTKK